MISNSNDEVSKTVKRKRKYKRKKSIDSKMATIQLFLAVLSLTIVIIGATYAYFNVSTNNTFENTNINTRIQDVGNVILSRRTANMSMNLTAINMIKQDSNINFYASSEGKTTEPTEEVLGTITANGNGKFNCEYDLVTTIDSEENMYTVFQNMADKSTEQIVLTINGDSYDFNTAELFPIRKHYIISDLEEDNPAEIKASLKIVNRKDIDQSALAGTNIMITFAVENFDCQLSGN